MLRNDTPDRSFLAEQRVKVTLPDLVLEYAKRVGSPEFPAASEDSAQCSPEREAHVLMENEAFVRKNGRPLNSKDL
ncbi:MAG: hypothetical protein NVS1B2_23550 [Vulcanimicrobiaceae bacterium]